MKGEKALAIPPSVLAAIATAPPTPALVYAPPKPPTTIPEEALTRLLIDGLLGHRVRPRDPAQAAYADTLWAELDALPSWVRCVDVPSSIPDVRLSE